MVIPQFWGTGPKPLGLILVQQLALPLVRGTTADGARRIEGTARAEIVRAQQGTITNADQEISLARLKRNQAAENMQDVHEFGRVLGEPTIRLDPFEG